MMARREVLRRRRRDLRHRRPGHQGPVHGERRHPELPAVEPVLGRQRHAAAGDGRPVRRAGDRVRGRRVQGAGSARSSATAARCSSTPIASTSRRRATRRKSCSRASRWCCRRTSGSTSCRSRAWPQLGRRYVLQGGTQYNLAAVKAQVDYIKARVPDARSSVHPHPGEAGAIGAALETLRVVTRRGQLDLHRPRCGDRSRVHDAATTRPRAATSARTTARARSSTPRPPDGRTSRYISGFSCEKGTVEIDGGAARRWTKKRKELQDAVSRTSSTTRRKLRVPQLLHAAADARGRHARSTTSRCRQTLLGEVAPEADAAPFRRSRGAREAAARRQIRIGIPRVLNIYSTAPFWRTYFETLGIRATQHRVQRRDHRKRCGPRAASTARSIRAIRRRSRRRTSTTCCSSKQREEAARLHLLPVHHAHARRSSSSTMDYAACPIVAGTPKVMQRGVHEGDRLLRRARHRVPRHRGDADRAELICQADVRDVGRAARHHRGRERLAPAARDSRRSQPFDDEMQRRAGRSSSSSRPRTASACCCSAAPITSIRASTTACSTSSRRSAIRSCRSGRFPKDPQLAGALLQGRSRSRLRSTTPLDDLRRVARELLDQQRAEGVGGEVRRAPSERRRARSVELQVRPRRADLRPDRQHHHVEPARPYSALHDIDANKPGGSIKIRVKTYAHTLKSLRGGAVDEAAKRDRAAAPRRPRSGASCCKAPRTAARSGAGRSARSARRSQTSRPPSPHTLKKMPFRRASPRPICGATSLRRHPFMPWCFCARPRNLRWRPSHDRSNDAELRRDRARADGVRGRGAQALGLDEERGALARRQPADVHPRAARAHDDPRSAA